MRSLILIQGLLIAMGTSFNALALDTDWVGEWRLDRCEPETQVTWDTIVIEMQAGGSLTMLGTRDAARAEPDRTPDLFEFRRGLIVQSRVARQTAGGSLINHLQASMPIPTDPSQALQILIESDQFQPNESTHGHVIVYVERDENALRVSRKGDVVVHRSSDRPHVPIETVVTMVDSVCTYVRR